MIIQDDYLSALRKRMQQNQDDSISSPQDFSTGDYLNAALQKMSTRQAPPRLDPSSRVTSPDTTLTQPGSFQNYYNQLGSIGQIGQNLLDAENARAIFRRQQALSTTPSSGGQANPIAPGIPSNPAENFKFAQQIAPQFGWNANDLNNWYRLGMQESGWKNTAQNPTSTAFGIGQFLDSTWGGVGISKTNDPYQQVLAMARYIKNRYGTPTAAEAHELSSHWY